jgi:hypothetical protein
MFNLATKSDLKELERDLRSELAGLRIELRNEILGIKTDILGLKEGLAKLRNSMWLSIIVPSLTLIVSLVIHYIFH